ncbi:MAG TPA: hypothetical protein VGG61_05865 [Gemmataceae bacterium]
MQLMIDPHGCIRCLYTEALDLSSFGLIAVRRASQVEPDLLGQWWAELSSVSGPRLGPFDLRSQALLAEQSWLEAHWLPHAAKSSSP